MIRHKDFTILEYRLPHYVTRLYDTKPCLPQQQQQEVEPETETGIKVFSGPNTPLWMFNKNFAVLISYYSDNKLQVFYKKVNKMRRTNLKYPLCSIVTKVPSNNRQRYKTQAYINCHHRFCEITAQLRSLYRLYFECCTTL